MPGGQSLGRKAMPPPLPTMPTSPSATITSEAAARRVVGKAAKSARLMTSSLRVIEEVQKGACEQCPEHGGPNVVRVEGALQEVAERRAGDRPFAEAAVERCLPRRGERGMLSDLERDVDCGPEHTGSATRRGARLQHSGREQAEGQRMNEAWQPLTERAEQVEAPERG